MRGVNVIGHYRGLRQLCSLITIFLNNLGIHISPFTISFSGQSCAELLVGPVYVCTLKLRADVEPLVCSCGPVHKYTGTFCRFQVTDNRPLRKLLQG